MVPRCDTRRTVLRQTHIFTHDTRSYRAPTHYHPGRLLLRLHAVSPLYRRIRQQRVRATVVFRYAAVNPGSALERLLRWPRCTGASPAPAEQLGYGVMLGGGRSTIFALIIPRLLQPSLRDAILYHGRHSRLDDHDCHHVVTATWWFGYASRTSTCPPRPPSFKLPQVRCRELCDNRPAEERVLLRTPRKVHMRAVPLTFFFRGYYTISILPTTLPDFKRRTRGGRFTAHTTTTALPLTTEHARARGRAMTRHHQAGRDLA